MKNLPVVYLKENPNHEPAGSPEGGQFAHGEGGGGSSGSDSGSGPKGSPTPPISHANAITRSSKVARVKVALKGSTSAAHGETHKYTVTGTPSNFDIFRRSLGNTDLGMTIHDDGSPKKAFAWTQQREAGKGGVLNFIFTLKSPAVKV